MNLVIENIKRAQLAVSESQKQQAKDSFVPLADLLPIPKHPRVLCWDIEASSLKLNWGHIFCIGMKWLGQPKTVVRSIMEYPEFLTNHASDRSLVNECARYLEQADLWVFHFGEFFDIRAVRTRLALYRGSPLAPIKFVDTWRLARKLALHSNRLDAVGNFLGLPEKTAIKPDLWNEANGGHPRAIREIIDHCKHDIPPLEGAYRKLRALMTDHPNLNLTYPDPADRNTNRCPTCGSANLKLEGHSFARTRVRDRWRCLEPDCGKWSVGVTSSIQGEGIR